MIDYRLQQKRTSMKRLLYIVIVFAALCATLASNSMPASARKDRFANKLHTFNTIVKELQSNYVDTLDATKIIDNALDYMLYQIDPYTEYYPANDQEEILSISQGQYAGIGSVISKRGNNVIINQPQDDSPSRRAGLRAGDVILTVDGDSVLPSMNVSDVSKRLRGQAGTEVRLSLRRHFVEDSLLTVTIVRDNIKVNPLPYYGLDEDGIGYIRLTTFNESAARSVREAVSSLLKKQGIKGIVLDLRGNGGGLLEGAVQIAANFVPRGTEIVRTRGRDKRDVKIYKTTTQPLSVDIPLVILTDNGTASASEIVAGSMQDLDRGLIIGERSYGKGLVQSTRPLPYGDLLKITTGRYYIPSGRLIQALDYSHRDEEGRPVRTPDSLTNVFQTAHGREVRDGGGITPDILLTAEKPSTILYNLATDFRIFDFATRYFAEHPQALADSLYSDVLFEGLKADVAASDFKYDKQWESAIDYLKKAAKEEGLMTDSVETQLETLSGLLRRDLGKEFDAHRGEIEEMLAAELMARYFSEGEQVRRTLPRDSTYIKAKEQILSGIKLY